MPRSLLASASLLLARDAALESMAWRHNQLSAIQERLRERRLSTRRSSKELHTAGTKPLERLFELVTEYSSVLAERVQGMVSNRLAPFAEEVVCIDESPTGHHVEKAAHYERHPEG